MSRNQRVHAWSVALACALIFLFSASAEQVVRAVAQVITPRTVVTAQDPPPVQEPPPPAAGRGGGRQGGAAAGPRNYTDVITAAFKTDDGIFKVHRGPLGGVDSVLYEIPKNQLDKDFLWNVKIKKTTLGTGFGGKEAASRVVRWHQRGDRILLQDINFSITADPANPVAQAVADANYPAIIRTLHVLAYSPSGDPVVDVTVVLHDRRGGVLGARRHYRRRRPRQRPVVPGACGLVPREHQR